MVFFKVKGCALNSVFLALPNETFNIQLWNSEFHVLDFIHPFSNIEEMFENAKYIKTKKLYFYKIV